MKQLIPIIFNNTLIKKNNSIEVGIELKLTMPTTIIVTYGTSSNNAD